MGAEGVGALGAHRAPIADRGDVADDHVGSNHRIEAVPAGPPDGDVDLTRSPTAVVPGADSKQVAGAGNCVEEDDGLALTGIVVAVQAGSRGTAGVVVDRQGRIPIHQAAGVDGVGLGGGRRPREPDIVEDLQAVDRTVRGGGGGVEGEEPLTRDGRGVGAVVIGLPEGGGGEDQQGQDGEYGGEVHAGSLSRCGERGRQATRSLPIRLPPSVRGGRAPPGESGPAQGSTPLLRKQVKSEERALLIRL